MNQTWLSVGTPHYIKQLSHAMATSLTIRGPEVLFKTCVAMKFVDDDDE